MIQILGDNNAVIGGLHMVHEREDQKVCGPVMPQGKNKSITGLVLPTTISAVLATHTLYFRKKFPPLRTFLL